MTYRIGSVLAAAQLAASLTRADQGAGFSRVRLYTTDRPDTPGVHSDTPQAVIALTKPCGALAGGVLSLTAADPGMVMAQGMPRWAEWIAADGALLADGTVTDMDNGGDFRVEGATTPEGETSPMLYTGGLVTLGTVVLT
ncbi:hypothetical protein [Ottowia sp. VDI28]|uniref:hypothetical protein n=1 Tax=Ottowia sp. VDI28 TaxID=3133968 RepID=UPI003C2E28AD